MGTPQDQSSLEESQLLTAPELRDLPEWSRPAVATLLNSLKQKDPYTHGHCIRVARNARKLAGAAGFNVFLQRMIEFAALFHDLGKIGVPDSVLLKPGRLTPEEEAAMREHPLKSCEIIAPLTRVEFFRALIPGIRSHHERIDGKGYPDALTGEEIPLASRIILIVDTYDAMTSDRPYRKGLDPEVAYRELEHYGGRQFDAELVRIFLNAHPSWKKEDDDATPDAEVFLTSAFKKTA